MKFSIMVIMAIVFTLCLPAWPAANRGDQVILLDVQGLWGGTNLWISGDKAAISCFVERPQKGESGLREICYSFKLSDEQNATLAGLVSRYDFFSIHTADRYGAPDEARPVLWMKSGGIIHAVAKWIHDKHPRFDPLYEDLLKIAQSGKTGTVVRKGAYDPNWKPEEFPENKDLREMTRPKPDGK